MAEIGVGPQPGAAFETEACILHGRLGRMPFLPAPPPLAWRCRRGSRLGTLAQPKGTRADGSQSD